MHYVSVYPGSTNGDQSMNIISSANKKLIFLIIYTFFFQGELNVTRFSLFFILFCLYFFIQLFLCTLLPEKIFMNSFKWCSKNIFRRPLQLCHLTILNIYYNHLPVLPMYTKITEKKN